MVCTQCGNLCRLRVLERLCCGSLFLGEKLGVGLYLCRLGVDGRGVEFIDRRFVGEGVYLGFCLFDDVGERLPLRIAVVCLVVVVQRGDLCGFCLCESFFGFLFGFRRALCAGLDLRHFVVDLFVVKGFDVLFVFQRLYFIYRVLVDLAEPRPVLGRVVGFAVNVKARDLVSTQTVDAAAARDERKCEAEHQCKRTDADE